MTTQRIRPLSDLRDPTLDVFRNLKDRRLKSRAGLFIAEGAEVVRRLLRSDFRVHSVLVCDEKLASVRDALPAEIPAYVGDHDQIETIVGFDARRYGVFACAYRRTPTTLESALGPACSRRHDGARGDALIVALENVNDPENVGAMIRNAAALGADLVVLGGCCDPYYRRATRVSMGAAFALPPHVSEDLLRDLESLKRDQGFRLVGSVLDDQATPLHAAERPPRAALIFGAEGAGLSPQVLELCDDRVTIPMSGGCDSLNVAVASGVFLHHYGRSGGRSSHRDKSGGRSSC